MIGLAAPNARDPDRLKRLARQDEELRKALVSDDAVFEHVMADDEAFVRVTPALYFEVLLRRALRELETLTHTVERSGRQAIPVFDTDEVVRLMEGPRGTGVPGGDAGLVHARRELREARAGPQGSLAQGALQRHGRRQLAALLCGGGRATAAAVLQAYRGRVPVRHGHLP